MKPLNNVEPPTRGNEFSTAVDLNAAKAWNRLITRVCIMILLMAAAYKLIEYGAKRAEKNRKTAEQIIELGK